MLGGLALAAATAAQIAAAASTPPKSWASVVAPLPADAITPQHATLGVPSCPQVGVCYALGSYISAAGTRGMVETLSRGDWVPTTMPLPANAAPAGGAPTVISCPAAGSCVAVGVYAGAGNHDTAFADLLAGGTWRPRILPLPSGAEKLSGSWVDSLSCPTATVCVAAGNYPELRGGDGPLIERYSAGTWHAAALPLPSGLTDPYPNLTGVSCGSTGSCVAIGLAVTSSGDPDGFLETYAGGRWTASYPPVPSGSGIAGVSLDAVSCPAAGACTVVGHAAASVGGAVGLVETLGPAGWRAAETPLPSDAGPDPQVAFTAIDCTAATDCVAVGTYRDASFEADGLLLTESAGSWTAEEAPLPSDHRPNLPETQLDALDCLSPDVCVVVGTYTAGAAATDLQGLFETQSGSIWVPVEASLPAGVSAPQLVSLGGVACPSGAWCVAVGTFQRSGPTSAAELLAPPRLILRPASSPAGATVSATASGFEAGAAISLHWGSLTGRVLATATTDTSGAADVTFVVPAAATAGNHPVCAVASGQSTCSSLAVG